MNGINANELIVRWAVQNGYPCRVAQGGGRNHSDGGVMVLLEHADVFFERGKLVRINIARSRGAAREMLAEMARLFAFCAALSAIEQRTHRFGQVKREPAQALPPLLRFARPPDPPNVRVGVERSEGVCRSGRNLVQDVVGGEKPGLGP